MQEQHKMLLGLETLSLSGQFKHLG